MFLIDVLFREIFLLSNL